MTKLWPIKLRKDLALQYSHFHRFRVCISEHLHSHPHSYPYEMDVRDWSLVNTLDIPYPYQCDEVPPCRDRSCISQAHISKDHSRIHMKSCSSRKQIYTSSYSLPLCYISENLPNRKSFCIYVRAVICVWMIFFRLKEWVSVCVRVLTIRVLSESLSSFTRNTQLIHTFIFIFFFNRHPLLQNTFVRLFNPFVLVLYGESRAASVGLTYGKYFFDYILFERR